MPVPFPEATAAALLCIIFALLLAWGARTLMNPKSPILMHASFSFQSWPSITFWSLMSRWQQYCRAGVRRGSFSSQGSAWPGRTAPAPSLPHLVQERDSDGELAEIELRLRLAVGPARAMEVGHELPALGVLEHDGQVRAGHKGLRGMMQRGCGPEGLREGQRHAAPRGAPQAACAAGSPASPPGT